MKAVFLDFDGVISNSIEETYIVSLKAYYGFSVIKNEATIKELFYKHRGLVGPPHNFCALHNVIEHVLDNQIRTNNQSFEQLFLQAMKSNQKRKDQFESIFFAIRRQLQNDRVFWLSLNPITKYGESLTEKDLPNYYLITTKDLHAVEMLLSEYNIKFRKIFSKNDYEEFGSKGAIINDVMSSEPVYKTGVFVDDSTAHLDTVSNPSVKCYFADWGYGVNEDYEIYNQEIW
tara:strand:- start:4233 stop:4925 length:693 start_codon:yes stop_codon:yes gene_type:complete